MLREAGLATRAPAYQVLGIEFLEEEVDHRARGFGGEALAPMLDAEPVAEFGASGLVRSMPTMPTGEWFVLDQEHGLAAARGGGADEFDRVVLRIGMRQAAGVFRDTAVVGEMRDGFYVRERRPAQRQPFGVEDAAVSPPARSGSRMSCNMSGLREVTARSAQKRKGGRFPASPWSSCSTPPVQQDPADSNVSTVYSAASAIGSTDTKVRPLALALELDVTFDLGEQSMVSAHADIKAGMPGGAALTRNDVAGNHALAADTP